MANVNPVDGIVYGFRLLGYLLVVFLAGGLITFIGADSGDTAGAFITFLGSLIILAGFSVSSSNSSRTASSGGFAPRREPPRRVRDSPGCRLSATLLVARVGDDSAVNRTGNSAASKTSDSEVNSGVGKTGNSAVSNSRASGTADKVVSNRASKDGNGGTSRVRTEPRADRVGKC